MKNALAPGIASLSFWQARGRTRAVRGATPVRLAQLAVVLSR